MSSIQELREKRTAKAREYRNLLDSHTGAIPEEAGKQLDTLEGEISALDDAIARHEKALEELRDQVPYPIRPLALDLTDRRSFQTYADALAEEPVEVGLLVNASGFGKFRAVVDTPLEVNLNMVDLNCQAVMALCQLTAPYMPRGGQIINIASVAAFQPIPYINVYGASKAFVLSFSRALNRELRSHEWYGMELCWRYDRWC